MQHFGTKGIPSLSRDKGTTGQAQNLAMGRDGPGQPIKILSWPVLCQDFELLSLCPAGQENPVLLETLFAIVVQNI